MKNGGVDCPPYDPSEVYAMESKLTHREDDEIEDSPRMSVSSNGYALEDDIRAIGGQMKRVLAFCELQSQNPVRLQDKINCLKQQLQDAIAEKNYWMKRCNQDARPAQRTTPQDIQAVNNYPRQRTNSELIVIADTLGSPSRGIYQDHPISNENALLSKGVRSRFRLLQCSDEECEVFTPMNRNICTQHRARSNVQFMWDEPPKTVLVVKKPNEPFVTEMLLRVTKWLLHEKMMDVYLEPSVSMELQIPGTLTWSKDEEWELCQNKIDFVVSLGGDGTVLWVSSLFRQSVPPVLALALGSLGFLTPFDVANDIEHLTNVINGGFRLSLRSRLVGTIIRKSNEHQKVSETHALNEIVIDRGSAAAMVELDCYCDGIHVTKIAADGIIIATPTGSTAYSLSAGGSMTHPSVPSMLFTPICPHTLSFRPLLFHDSATLRIVSSTSSRSTAYVSFDGKNRVQLDRGDSVIVRVSSFPLPAVCQTNENQDWFESMTTNLNWNQRRESKAWPKSSKAQSEMPVCDA